MFLGETESRTLGSIMARSFLTLGACEFSLFICLPSWAKRKTEWALVHQPTPATQLCIKKIAVIRSHASGLQPFAWRGQEKSFSLLPPQLMAKYMFCSFGCSFVFKTSESEPKWWWAQMKSKAATQKMLPGYVLFSYPFLLTPQICDVHQLWWLINVYREGILVIRAQPTEGRRYWYRIGTDTNPT